MANMSWTICEGPVGPLSVVAAESSAANERTGRTEDVFMRRVIDAASPVNPALIQKFPPGHF